MRLIWDSQSQIRRNDRVELAASLEAKAERFHPDLKLSLGESGKGYRLPPSFLAARSGKLWSPGTDSSPYASSWSMP